LLFFYADYNGHQQELAFVQLYSFDYLEYPVEVCPHGNSKKISRTNPSTLKLLKDAIQTKGTKEALREVENLKGGVLNAKSASDLRCH